MESGTVWNSAIPSHGPGIEPGRVTVLMKFPPLGMAGCRQSGWASFIRALSTGLGITP